MNTSHCNFNINASFTRNHPSSSNKLQKLLRSHLVVHKNFLSLAGRFSYMYVSIRLYQRKENRSIRQAKHHFSYPWPAIVTGEKTLDCSSVQERTISGRFYINKNGITTPGLFWPLEDSPCWDHKDELCFPGFLICQLLLRFHPA